MAKAKDAKVSMIRLTQSIYTGVSGDYLIVNPPTMAAVTATTFTQS